MMTTDDEFAHRLIEFGLSEKEALVYFHLLKYGPNTQSRLAKAQKTCREDVRPTLNNLIGKSMVRPSLDGSAVYTAVDLDAALDFAMKKQRSELIEMEARKLVLKELAKQQRFRPSDNSSTLKMLKNRTRLHLTIKRDPSRREYCMLLRIKLAIARRKRGGKHLTDNGGTQGYNRYLFIVRKGDLKPPTQSTRSS